MDTPRDADTTADARLGEARRALHRLGGELRTTSRSLDVALDAGERTDDDDDADAGAGPEA